MDDSAHMPHYMEISAAQVKRNQEIKKENELRTKRRM